MTKASSGTSWKSCTCGCKHGQTGGERILVRVEGVDKVERSTLAVDCTEADFRTFETALYQILQDDNKRTTEDGSTSAGSVRI